MQLLSFFGRTGIVTVTMLLLIDLLVRTSFPHFLRFETNFSASYLRRTIAPQTLSGKDLFLGDSVLWGYKIAANDAAVSELISSGVPAENLSFEGGSVVNTYALLKTIVALGAHPRSVVFNINLKEFNSADSAYSTLYPGLERVSWAYLSADERARLTRTQSLKTFDALADDRLGKVWALYGMRADIRNALFGDSDAASELRSGLNDVSGESARAALQHVPTPDKFLGTYDLSTLSESNVEVFFLDRLAELVRRHHLRAVAILSPTNHTLLHDYIDGPEYAAQLKYIRAHLASSGITVLDYDRAFSAREFIDNDHLTASANVKLAALLRRDVRL